jgi:RNA polymerase sigma-70 factor (ECF subfamily)
MLDLSACSDGELAALALAGRQVAYGALLNRHRARVFRIARYHSGDDDAALDLTQQSFIAAFAAMTSYDPSRSFEHWISRIAINKCHDWARRRKVRQFFTFAKPLEAAHDISDPAAGADAQAADRQALQQTMAAIALLPAKLKEVLVLRTIEGQSQTETAAILAISEKAVETRLYRAREKLGLLLKQNIRGVNRGAA